MKFNRIENQSQNPQLLENRNGKQTIKLRVRFRGLNPHATWHALVLSKLRRLQPLAAIASAEVILERQREGKPTFRARAELEVPGPDFHAEATDYTLQAALQKVMKNLERQIRLRKAKQGARTNLRPGLRPNQGPITI